MLLLGCTQTAADAGVPTGTSATTPRKLESPCPRKEVQQGGTLPPNVGDPHGTQSPWPWAVPLFNGVKASKPTLRDHFDPLYPDFNTDYPDQLRADEFLSEFAGFVEARRELKTLAEADRVPARAWLDKADARDAALAASRKFADDAMANLAKPAQ